jgi:hypothetical protein
MDTDKRFYTSDIWVLEMCRKPGSKVAMLTICKNSVCLAYPF